MTPHLTANRRAANVSTQLARAETARMTPYPTTGARRQAVAP